MITFNRMIPFLTVLAAVIWFVFSFTLTDPNLFFSWNPTFVRIQHGLWGVTNNRTLHTLLYVTLVLVSFGLYSWWCRNVTTVRKSVKVLTLTGVVGLLIVSNPALSHDLYNYMFNAKAVVQYHRDPHVLSALEIAPQDEWLRFMHNVHTKAPYGYAWTYISLLPGSLGFFKFLPTFFLFKIFMVVSLALLFFIQSRLLKLLQPKKNLSLQRLALLFFNPLLLLETIMNVHNDIVMMVFFFASIYVVLQKNKYIFIPLGILLFILSTQIKLATLVVTPVFFYFIIRDYLPSRNTIVTRFKSVIETYWADLSALVLFALLTTERSKQFLPWYLIWVMTFLPFIHSKGLRSIILAFSLTSLLRYLVFFFYGYSSDATLMISIGVTWSALFIALAYILYTRIVHRSV